MLIPLPQKFNRFRFYIPAPCFVKNTSASGSSKNQMLLNSPLPASFFKVLPFPQKFNLFHIPATNACKTVFFIKQSVILYKNKVSGKKITSVCANQ